MPLSPEDLKLLKDEYGKLKIELSQLEGSTADNPLSTDLYKSDLLRTGTSFGNTEGIKPHLEKQGYTEVHENPSGDLVARGPDGLWHRDSNHLLTGSPLESLLARKSPFENPINAVESKLGHALPLAGMAIGGTAGLETAGPPGAVAGAGVGAGAGEALRAAVGQSQGTYSNSPMGAAADVFREAQLGSAGELGGRAVGMIPIGGGKTIDDAAQAAARALVDRGKRDATSFSSVLSGVDSEATRRAIERPAEVMAAGDPGAKLSIAEKAKEEYLAHVAEMKDKIQKARAFFQEQYKGVQPKDISPLVDSTNSFMQRQAPNAMGMGPVSDAEMQQVAELGKSLPNQSLGDLQKTADYIDSQITKFDQAKNPSSGDTRYQAYLRQLRGKIKGMLHEADPEGLGAADAAYHQFATASRAVRPLEDPTRMESFVDNFYGKNKTIQQDMASQVIPDSMGSLQDLATHRAFQGRPGISGLTGRNAFQGAVVGSGLVGVGMTQNPSLLGYTALAAGATAPRVHRALLTNGSQALSPWANLFKQSPQFLELMSRQALSGMKNPWSLLPPEQK